MYWNKTSLWCTFGKMESHSEQGDWSLVTCLVDTGDNPDGKVGWGGEGWARIHRGHMPAQGVGVGWGWGGGVQMYRSSAQLSPFSRTQLTTRPLYHKGLLPKKTSRPAL